MEIPDLYQFSRYTKVNKQTNKPCCIHSQTVKPVVDILHGINLKTSIISEDASWI